MGLQILCYFRGSHIRRCRGASGILAPDPFGASAAQTREEVMRRRLSSTSEVWAEAARGVRRGRRYTSRCGLRGPLLLSGACLVERHSGSPEEGTADRGEESAGATFLSPIKHHLSGPQAGANKLGTTRKGKPGSRGSENITLPDTIYSTKNRGQLRVKGGGRVSEKLSEGAGVSKEAKGVIPGSITKYFQAGVGR
ncbi:hypothetical protein NDU88_003818 [Pleurodeles waltl]|uniref:Uncharacterized protein n=1 Tax=Pleurodeles waltl TaxID=8319 RepID=A0AAV7NHQ7_PLEWA|nr:hypothetical protein NDU88_003818 [Pleurodeles waltl]